VKFGIVIQFDRKKIRLQVEKIFDNGFTAKFRVIAKNNIFVLETNKPLLKNKGLKYKKPVWKVVEGGELRTSIVDLIIKEIENAMD